MQPIDKKKLEKLIEEAKAEGKATLELEKMLTKEVKPPMGEIKEESIGQEVWMKTERGSEKRKEKGKRVIISTGPAREEDFI